MTARDAFNWVVLGPKAKQVPVEEARRSRVWTILARLGVSEAEGGPILTGGIRWGQTGRYRRGGCGG
jgi:hypothetical protein